ncbi:hypothetical protein HDU98_000540 [Podochytrium sp. JEL0797]|nr:hypothetical protein HDU98_000540 [Podochytrium sp. JEL0797]
MTTPLLAQTLATLQQQRARIQTALDTFVLEQQDALRAVAALSFAANKALANNGTAHTAEHRSATNDVAAQIAAELDKWQETLDIAYFTASSQTEHLKDQNNLRSTQLSHMPFDVLAQIFAWLHPEMVRELFVLSKHFNEALNTKPLVRMCLKRNVVPTYKNGQMLLNCDSVWLWQNQLWAATFAEVILSNQSDIKLDDFEQARLPESIHLLKNTKRLHITGCFYGPIHRSIGSLTNLTVLNLACNQLSGHIPPDLGLLRNLTKLTLDNSKLTGSIPPELKQLKQLESLSLANNKLTGPIPVELYALVGLKFLNLGSNRLTGGIDSEIGGMTVLCDLALHNNRLTGQIPRSILNLTKLEECELEGNAGLTCRFDFDFWDNGEDWWADEAGEGYEPYY